MAPNYAKLAKERFTGTKIYGYDEITAVSQKGINNQFNLIFNASDPQSRHFTTATTEDDDWSQIVNAELAPPTFELLLGSDEKQTVLFTLNVKSGTFKYLGGPIRNPTEETATIKDWRIAFDARLKLEAVAEQNVPTFIKTALNNPSNYTVNKLVVDFASIDISKHDESRSFMDLPTDKAKNEFGNHIGLYLSSKAAILHSAIYYLPALKQALPGHSLGRSITPTALTFQNFPFVVSSTDSGTKGSPDNLLVYLQMTEGRTPPKDMLPHPSSNWVVPPATTDPNEKYDGTIGISERAIIPLLSFFNQQSTWIAESVAKGNPPIVRGHCGYADGEVISKSVLWEYDAQNSTPTARKYTYKSSSITKPAADAPLTFQEGRTQNKLEIPVGLDPGGKCVIKLEGKTDVVTAIGGFGSAIQSASWTGKVTLDSSTPNSFKIDLNVSAPNVTETLFGDDSIQAVVQPFKQSLESALARLNSAELKTQLNQLLAGTWKFIYANNGGFVVKEGAFNTEGDLLLKIIQSA